MFPRHIFFLLRVGRQVSVSTFLAVFVGKIFLSRKPGEKAHRTILRTPEKREHISRLGMAVLVPCQRFKEN